MTRRALIACLAVTLLSGGCVSRQSGVLVPSADPQELAARIAETGRSPGRVTEEEPEGSARPGNCLKATVVAGEVCLGVLLACAYGIAQSGSDAWGRR